VLTVDNPSVEYSLTRDEYWRFNRYLMDNSPKLRTTRHGVRLLFFGLPFFVVLLPLRDLMLTGPFHAAFVLVLATIVATAIGVPSLLVNRYSLRRRIERLPAEGGPLLALRTLSVEPRGIVETCAAGDGSVAWGAVREIVEDSRQTYLMVDDVCAYIVPERAFPSNAEYRSFIETARSYTRVAAARGS
jgi:hypothetical protein